MRRRRRTIAAALAGAVAVVAVATPAFAADTLTVRSLDTTDYPVVRAEVIAAGKVPDLATFALRENEKIIQDFSVVPIGETEIPVGVVLDIDVSGSMNDGNALQLAKDAAKQFVAQRLANDRIAIVAFGSSDRVVLNFTDDVAALNAAIDSLVAQGETALFDSVRTSVALYDEHPELQRNVVVLTDGTDTVSSTTRAQAEAAAIDAKTAVFTIGIETGEFDAGALGSLAGRTGGQYLPASDPNALAEVYGSVQRALQNQYEITYTSTSSSAAVEVAISAAGFPTVKAQTTVGGRSEGANTRPEVIDGPSVPTALTGSGIKWLALLLSLVAAALLAYGVILLVVRDRDDLDSQLAFYTEGGGAEGSDDQGSTAAILRVGAVRQAVAFAGRVAEDRGLEPRIEKMMEKADLPIRAGEALFFYLALFVVGSALGLVLTQSLFSGLIIAVVLLLLPPAVVQFLGARRQRQFLAQLPDTLQLLSGSLRAGYSLMQGVEAVSQEVDDPMGAELRRIVAESRLGRPLEDALDDAAGRLGSADFAWAVMAIKIQREVGGNLSELLDTVADTMIARERLRRDVRALTAEGRISAILLGVLPVGMLATLWLINREYIEILFEETLGKALLLGGAVLAGVGFVWLNKIVKIEI